MDRVEDLYELIGILDSINYDEIINDREINALKEWINNRKNISDEQLLEIIKIVEEILKDNIVTEDEKKQILVIVNDFNKNKLNDQDKLSVLMGVINGIVSDNEVNEKEIKKLQFWILNNVDLAHYPIYQRIFHLLKNINLKDFDELTVLNEFKNISFESFITGKTQSLKYRLSNNKLIGNDLITLIGEEDMIKKVHRSAMIQLDYILLNKASIIESDCEIIIISLSLIALLYYDGNFWKYVRSTYSELYEKYSDQKIEGKIREIILKFSGENNDEQRIISYILENAIVPKKFIPSFFDFIYDIYKYNFECNISDKNIYEEFEFIYDGLKSAITKVKEDDELEVNVIKGKTYKLIKSTRNVIINDNSVKDIIELSRNILMIIDAYYWNNKNICGSNIYYNYGFEEWIKTINIESEKNENKEKKSRFSSSWKPEFVLENNNVYLVPPTHKVKNDYNYEYIRVVLTCNGETVYDNSNPEIYEMFGGYKVIVDKIKIDNPLGDIRYYVYCNNDVIYDSKELLYRSYIIFNKNGIEYKNNTDYNGQINIAHSKDDTSFGQVYEEKENYCLSTKVVNVGDTFTVGNDLINFSTKLECGIVGNKTDAVLYSDIEYPIYLNVEKYIIESTEHINNIGIMINDKRTKLSDLDYQIKSRGGYNDYIIDLKLDSNEIYSLYAFKINDDTEISKSRINFAIADTLNYSSKQLDNEKYEINVSSSLFDSNVNEILNIKTNKDLIISSFVNSKKYDLFLKLDIKLFKLDDNEWMNFDDYIWIKDVNNYSKLYTYGLDSDRVIVKGNKTVTMSTIYNRQKNNIIGLYEIGSSIANNYEDDSLKILFFNDESIVANLTCCCKTVLANASSLYSYDANTGIVRVTPKLYGKGEITLRIYDEDNIVYFKDITSINEVIEIKDLKSFKEYKIEIVEKAEEFSFDDDRVLFFKKDCFYFINDFSGKYFKLDRARISQTIEGVFQFKTFILKNTYVSLREQIEPGIFNGEIYYYSEGRKYVFKTCNPVEVELVSDPINDTIEVAITYEGDGLLVDFNRRTILDKDDPRATDIYSYEMNFSKGGKEWLN